MKVKSWNQACLRSQPSTHSTIAGGWISRVPVLVRDSKNPDDVDTQQEDHDWDGTRYAVLHSPPKKVGKVTSLRL
ncbi:Uncharacterised protein [Leclercia adecarboxylata]|uniref:Uncharacterized protein n=1 Tax=Leclercia adecarboxylata TaxID=83655 RepID=A0A4U9HTR7_9ENTR|nr:Uncharacterised protein [Leclercia adecarboxylata]